MSLRSGLSRHLAIAVGLVFAAGILVPAVSDAYANPGVPHGYVNDFANLLSTDQRQLLEHRVSAFKAATGDQLAIVTIENMAGDTIEHYANRLFHDWGIGQKGKDNGVLLLIALQERKVRIEVGYGLEGQLTDAATKQMIRRATPALHRQDFASGIDQIISDIIQTLDPNADAAATDLPPIAETAPLKTAVASEVTGHLKVIDIIVIAIFISIFGIVLFFLFIEPLLQLLYLIFGGLFFYGCYKLLKTPQSKKQWTDFKKKNKDARFRGGSGSFGGGSSSFSSDASSGSDDFGGGDSGGGGSSGGF